jgi:hypothetical protein
MDCPMRVIELRNYLLRPGTTRDFVRYFEEHFLLSQRAEGMHPLGQFEVVGEPDRFVWIRGFEDMRARLRGLTAFYGGPFWQARRDQANAMILEHHHVDLLRPLAPVAALTGGASLEDRQSAPAGAVPLDAGLAVADFYRADPAALAALVHLFEHDVRPALVHRGHRVLGHFVAELSRNDYPRLPVIQDPGLLVALSTYRDEEHSRLARKDWDARGPILAGPFRSRLTEDVVSLRLRPTARSLIRHVRAADE